MEPDDDDVHESKAILEFRWYGPYNRGVVQGSLVGEAAEENKTAGKEDDAKEDDAKEDNAKEDYSEESPSDDEDLPDHEDTAPLMKDFSDEVEMTDLAADFPGFFQVRMVSFCPRPLLLWM